MLRRSDFGEADRVLTLFTPAHGKLHTVAKGIRRTTSRKAGHLEPFMRSQLLLAAGRDMDIITQAEERERFEHLRSSLWHATGAWYVAELVDRFLEDSDPHPRVFRLFLDTLRTLDETAAQGDESRGWLALRYFELHLLDELGYRPGFHHCTSCDTPLRPEENGFSAEMGGALCPACRHSSERRLALPALKVLRLLQTSTWEAVPRLRIDGDLRRDIDAALQSLLRHHLDRELKSWPFLARVAEAPH